MGPEELREPRALGQVAAALRRIHACDPIDASFDAFRLVEDYAAATRSRGGEVPPAYDVAHAAAARIEAVPALADAPPVLCHDDLLPANFIDTPDGIRIVDWEYAGVGSRWFDLGNFAVNNELGPAEEEGFMTAYLGTAPTRADLAALRLMRLMSDFREAMWGVVQQRDLRPRLRLRRLRDQALRPPAGGDRRRRLRGLAGGRRCPALSCPRRPAA